MFLVLRSKGLISFSSVNDFHFRNVVPILLSFPCNTLLAYVHRIQWEIQLMQQLKQRSKFTSDIRILSLSR